MIEGAVPDEFTVEANQGTFYVCPECDMAMRMQFIDKHGIDRDKWVWVVLIGGTQTPRSSTVCECGAELDLDGLRKLESLAAPRR